jgi:DnaJ-class molecular chaperone
MKLTKEIKLEDCKLCKGTGRRGFKPRKNCEYTSIGNCRKCKGTGKIIKENGD